MVVNVSALLFNDDLFSQDGMEGWIGCQASVSGSEDNKPLGDAEGEGNEWMDRSQSSKEPPLPSSNRQHPSSLWIRLACAHKKLYFLDGSVLGSSQGLTRDAGSSEVLLTG